MGVLTHLDTFKNNKQLNRVKKTLKNRFWTEICDGAKMFYLSGRESERKEGCLDIQGRIERPPLESTPGNQELWQHARTAADQLGIDIEQAAAGGGSDGNWTSQYCPTLDGLGSVGDGAHAVHEHVVENKLPERSALLACLLMTPALP